MLETKQQLLELVKQKVIDKIRNAEIAIASAKESKLNETKSTAGDKFETGRAMMQVEQEKSEIQLAKSTQLLAVLKQIDPNKNCDKVDLGAIVYTNQYNYFISIGIGKVKLNQKDFYVISTLSPVGALLINKKVGQSIEFRDQRITIERIV